MKNQGCRANFTHPENLHLTLAFIGETFRVEEIQKALDKVNSMCFEMDIVGSGHFGSLFYADIEKNKELVALVENIRCVLTKMGILIDKKPFSPHITLAREVVCAKKPVLYIERTKVPVKGFSLMKSERINGKLIYTKIYEKIFM